MSTSLKATSACLISFWGLAYLFVKAIHSLAEGYVQAGTEVPLTFRVLFMVAVGIQTFVVPLLLCSFLFFLWVFLRRG